MTAACADRLALISPSATVGLADAAAKLRLQGASLRVPAAGG